MKKKLFFLLFTTLIYADILTKLEQPAIIKGDDAILTITVLGKNIETPQINQICNSPAQLISTENFFNSINGNINQGKKFHFSFRPEANCTIQTIPVVINGRIENTQPLKVIVNEPSYKPTDPFSIQVLSDKSSYFVGEPIKIIIKYREDLTQDIIKRNFTKPESKDLWIKTEGKIKEDVQGNDHFLKLEYFGTAEKSGIIELSPAKMSVALRRKRRDSWGFMFDSVQWKKVISNSLKIDVKNSPTKYVGDFNISVSVDKNHIKAGKAVNLLLEIKGRGNIENIEPFKINIANGVVYDETPKKVHKNISGNYLGIFTQKFAVVLEQNETIPSFEIEYFNPKINKIVTKKTKPIFISVEPHRQTIQNQELEVIKPKQNSNLNTTQNINYLYLLLAFLSGVFTTLIIFYLRKHTQKIDFSREKLLNKVLPLVAKNPQMLEIAEKLQKNEKLTYKEKRFLKENLS